MKNLLDRVLGAVRRRPFIFVAAAVLIAVVACASPGTDATALSAALARVDALAHDQRAAESASDELAAQLEDVQAELATTTAELEAIEAELDQAQSDAEAAASEAATAQSELAAAESAATAAATTASESTELLAAEVTAALPLGVPSEAQRAQVVSITDGDTFRAVMTGPGLVPVGEERPIRLLEIDAPEQGVCGADVATAALAAAIPIDAEVWLLADQDSTDQYDRELRYLYDAAGGLVNEALVRAGVVWTVLYEPNDLMIDQLRAIEAEAQAADLGIWAPPCDRDGDQAPQPVAAPPPPPPAEAPAESEPAPRAACDDSYPDVCIPPAPPDLDCGDVAHTDIRVVGSDPHGFDGNNDGVGCES